MVQLGMPFQSRQVGRQAGRQTRPSNKQKRQSRCWIRTYIYVQKTHDYPLCFLCLKGFYCMQRCTSRTTKPREPTKLKGVEEFHPADEMKRGSDNDIVFEVGPDPMPHNPMCRIGAAVAHSELSGGDGMAAAFASPARHA